MTDADAVPMRGSAERLITAGRERAKDFDAAGGMERLVRHFREVART